jgi:hypothetical protein
MQTSHIRLLPRVLCTHARAHTHTHIYTHSLTHSLTRKLTLTAAYLTYTYAHAAGLWPPMERMYPLPSAFISHPAVIQPYDLVRRGWASHNLQPSPYPATRYYALVTGQISVSSTSTAIVARDAGSIWEDSTHYCYYNRIGLRQ